MALDIYPNPIAKSIDIDVTNPMITKILKDMNVVKRCNDHHDYGYQNDFMFMEDFSNKVVQKKHQS